MISRRDFIKELSRLGLTAASAPIALKAFLEFNQELFAQDRAPGRKGPPDNGTDKFIEALYYEKLGNNKIKCTLCPNFHIYKPGETSFCFTRVNQKGVLMTHAYNNPCTLSIDPIEKGPFNHFLPETNVLSIALGGCNLRCLYCQNWQISMERPEKVKKCDFNREDAVRWLKEKECKTICYTYTEPVVYPEYIKEVAGYTNPRGVRNIACTAGFINPEPLKDLCKVISAFAVTLKAFNDKFYQKICGQTLAPILQSMETIKSEKRHLEIVNLIVPSYNDDMDVIKKMCQWIKKTLGSDTPLHFGRFVPEYKLKDLPPTPAKTLEQARQIGLDEGLKYVYVFNLAPHDGNNTYCPSCKKPVVKRLAFRVLENNLTKGKCNFCGHKLAGVWEYAASFSDDKGKTPIVSFDISIELYKNETANKRRLKPGLSCVYPRLQFSLFRIMAKMKWIVLTAAISVVYSAIFTCGGCDSPANSGSSKWPLIDAPSNLAVTPLSASQYRLDWHDNSFNEDGFLIELTAVISASVATTVTAVERGITTYILDLTPDPDIIYSARVRAYFTDAFNPAHLYYSYYSNQAIVYP